MLSYDRRLVEERKRQYQKQKGDAYDKKNNRSYWSALNTFIIRWLLDKINKKTSDAKWRKKKVKQ